MRRPRLTALTSDQKVTYSARRDGRGVQGACRPDPPRVARRAAPRGRSDAERARGALPMSRFGVMKHLRVLEDAGLVVTKRRGREKLHFLNPVPIRLIHDRWVSRYAEPWAATLTGLKRDDRGADDGEGVRDLHQDDPGAAVGGDHRPGAAQPLHVRRRARVRLDARDRSTRPSTASRGRRSSRARTSRSTRRAGSCRASTRCGARTCARRGPRASPGRSSRWATPAGCCVIHDQLREGANGEIYGGWPRSSRG